MNKLRKLQDKLKGPIEDVQHDVKIGSANEQAKVSKPGNDNHKNS